MTTDNVAEMTPEQLRNELTATKRVAQLWFRKAKERKRELAQARADHEQSAHMVREENTRLAQSLMQARSELTDACAARDALARECNQLEADREYSASLVMGRDRELTRMRKAAQEQGDELKDLQGANRALARQLADVTDNREFWFKQAQALEMDLYHAAEEQAIIVKAAEALLELPFIETGVETGHDVGLAAKVRNAKIELRRALEYHSEAAAKLLERLATLDAAEREAAIAGRLAILDTVEATLADCGTDGVYAEFDEPADAIVQMDDRIKELTARLAALDAAESALASCGIGGIYGTFDGLKNAIQQMSEYIKELTGDPMEIDITIQQRSLDELAQTVHAERQLRQRAETSERAARETLAQAVVAQADAELAAHFHSKAVDELTQTVETERRLRRGAEHHVGDLHQELGSIHQALNECQVPRDYPDGTGASRRTRIFWLNERAERAEVLVKELRGERDYWERTADQEADQRQKARHNLKTERQECYNLHAKIETAEQRAENAEAQLSNGHKALTAAGILLSDANGRLSITGRVMRLRRRAERAEALAQLVTKKAADLLERLANHTAAYADSFADPNSSWTLLRRAEIRAARKLAAQIREVLDEH